jgi:hypothetical protein
LVWKPEHMLQWTRRFTYVDQTVCHFNVDSVPDEQKRKQAEHAMRQLIRQRYIPLLGDLSAEVAQQVASDVDAKLKGEAERHSQALNERKQDNESKQDMERHGKETKKRTSSLSEVYTLCRAAFHDFGASLPVELIDIAAWAALPGPDMPNVSAERVALLQDSRRCQADSAAAARPGRQL